jgi:hypothetical protein
MAHDQQLERLPPAPRSLRTVRGARLELQRLYVLTKNGHVEPAVAGKLSHILSLLIGSARDHQFDERLAKLEANIAAVGKANGHDRRSGLRP